MLLRNYNECDCKCLADLFYETVHSVNIKDYTKEQLDVWATGKVDLKAWNKSFNEHYTVVAEKNGIIVGFGDIDKSGYLDRLFVHRDYQRQGIGSAVCDELEKSVKSGRIITHSCVTAKPFFEKRGYKVIKEEQTVRNGISLTYYIMEKLFAEQADII